MTDHQVVTPDAWVEARKHLLAKEKEFTRLRDQFAPKLGTTCAHCTMWADGFNGVFEHLRDRAAFVKHGGAALLRPGTEAKHQQLAHGGNHNLLSFETPPRLEAIDQSNDRWVKSRHKAVRSTALPILEIRTGRLSEIPD